jgi:hypothetical protein
MRTAILPAVLVPLLALASARPAAACAVTAAEPDATLPTQPHGQTLTFVTTDDCRLILVFAQGELLPNVPLQGAPAGVDRHRYSVTLSPDQWAMYAGPDYTTFHWLIQVSEGRRSANYHLPATNELDVDRDGWTRSDGDAGECDFDATRNPGEAEVAGNGVDDDCDGAVDE